MRFIARLTGSQFLLFLNYKWMLVTWGHFSPLSQLCLKKTPVRHVHVGVIIYPLGQPWGRVFKYKKIILVLI